MKTFSLNKEDTGRAVKIWSTLKNNEGYFKKFNMDKWKEAMLETFVLSMNNYDDRYGDLTPYIKKLARTVLKVHESEIAYDIYNTDGEVSAVFLGLQEHQDISHIDGVDGIKKVFKDLYLLDENSFMALKSLYSNDNVADLRGIRVKDEVFKSEFAYLIRKFGAELTFKVLSEFFEELPSLLETKEFTVKEIKLKEANYTYLNKISVNETIKDSKGYKWGINKTTLAMQLYVDKESLDNNTYKKPLHVINPDFEQWDIVGTSICDVLRIDITPLMDYIYTQVYVPQNVNTNFITWCGDRYKVITPGGTTLINYDLDKFIKLVRTELIMNFIQNNINVIVALSEDNVYIKPTRAFKANSLRLVLYNDKIIDLPVHTHIKKRKR